MDSAKIFMTGRSQAVRLPKAYRFQSEEVLLERQPDGALLLRPKPKLPLGERLREILKDLPDDPTFVRPDQPALERGIAWWAANGFVSTPKGAPRKRKKPARR
jgi:antitoxin VapB